MILIVITTEFQAMYFASWTNADFPLKLKSLFSCNVTLFLTLSAILISYGVWVRFLMIVN